MQSARTRKRKALSQISRQFLFSVSASPNGDVDVYLPGRHRPVSLKSSEVPLIQAALGQIDRPSNKCDGPSSGLSSAICGTEIHA